MHIVVTFQATTTELVRALHRARRGWRIALAIVMVLLFLLAVAGFAGRDFPLGGYCTALALVYAFGLSFGQRLTVRRHRIPRQLTTVTLTDEAMTLENDLFRGEFKWAAFIRAKETRKFFLLFQSRRMLNVLPKRAFTPEQASEFAAFLANGRIS